MEFNIRHVTHNNTPTECIIVGVYENNKLSFVAQDVNRVSQNQLLKILKRSGFSGELGKAILLHTLPNIKSERILLVGLGKASAFDGYAYRKALQTAAQQLRGSGAKRAINYLITLPVKGLSLMDRVAQIVETTTDVWYTVTTPRQQKIPESNLTMLIPAQHKADMAVMEQGLCYGQALAAGVKLTKDLGNLPPNICTPSYLGQIALQLQAEHHIAVEVLERDAVAALGMGAFLGVAQGSVEPPKFIVLNYQGAGPSDAPVVLVGKGITFDTGGISLKPPADMDEMKYDMCGAASVLGTFKAIALMALKLNVVGLIPTCENMPDGRAIKPGDILTSMSGLTIEVLNTDAEGRLILCDALHYAERFKPSAVVDIATLTGACVIALGHHASGVMGNHQGLVNALIAAGGKALDRAWQLPLWEDYQSQLDSNFADIANVGGRAAGSITAACFLARFTKKYRWAHMDIAGTAWHSGKNKGGTGRPVPLLVKFLCDHAN